MKIEDLKVGLYFTLPEENLAETRKYGNNFDEEPELRNRLKFYTVIKHGNEWYMLNTLCLPYPRYEDRISLKYGDKVNLEKYIKQITREQDSIYEKAISYRNPCRIKLTQKALDLFDFAFDLRDCKTLVIREANDYKERDIIEVALSGPITVTGPVTQILTNKNNKPDPTQQQLAALREFSDKIKLPYFNIAALEALLENFENIEGKNEELFKEIKTYSNKIKEIKQELKIMDDNFKWFDPETGIIK